VNCLGVVVNGVGRQGPISGYGYDHYNYQYQYAAEYTKNYTPDGLPEEEADRAITGAASPVPVREEKATTLPRPLTAGPNPLTNGHAPHAAE
jgi:hypothetical protein